MNAAAPAAEVAPTRAALARALGRSKAFITKIAREPWWPPELPGGGYDVRAVRVALQANLSTRKPLGPARAPAPPAAPLARAPAETPPSPAAPRARLAPPAPAAPPPAPAAELEPLDLGDVPERARELVLVALLGGPSDEPAELLEATRDVLGVFACAVAVGLEAGAAPAAEWLRAVARELRGDGE